MMMGYTVRDLIRDYAESLRKGGPYENSRLKMLWVGDDGSLYYRAAAHHNKMVTVPVRRKDGEPALIVDKSIYEGKSQWGSKVHRLLKEQGIYVLPSATERLLDMQGVDQVPVEWAASFASVPFNTLQFICMRYHRIRGIPDNPVEWQEASSALRTARTARIRLEFLVRCAGYGQKELTASQCMYALKYGKKSRTLLRRIDATVRTLKQAIAKFSNHPTLCLPEDVKDTLADMDKVRSRKEEWKATLDKALKHVLRHIDRHEDGIRLLREVFRRQLLPRGQLLDAETMPNIVGTYLPLMYTFETPSMIDKVLVGAGLGPVELLQFAARLKKHVPAEGEHTLGMVAPEIALKVGAEGRIDLLVQIGRYREIMTHKDVIRKMLALLGKGVEQ